MTKEEKLLKMFHAVHYNFNGSGGSSATFEVKVTVAEQWDDFETSIEILKDGDCCACYTEAELLFDYLTRDWE